MRFRALLAILVVLILWRPAPAAASLTVFHTYVGNVGLSTDGWGSLDQSGVISASAPAGATVLAAFLYTTTNNNGSLSGVGGTLNGTPVNYASLGVNTSACCQLTAGRTDVTSIVAPVINGGPGGIYNFAITETSVSQDGEALVIVYTLPSLPIATIGILDGFASVTGDSTSLSFATPLNPAAPGFVADMRLGIGFSCGDPGCAGYPTPQASTVAVNGTTITTNAGNHDDSEEALAGDGNLITVGGFDDPYSPFLPSYADDHERYDLTPEIANGSTLISVTTSNASQDDNIFLATFFVSGEALVNNTPGAVPEPGTISLLLCGGILAAGYRKFRRSSR
jgi:hypothetical protein